MLAGDCAHHPPQVLPSGLEAGFKPGFSFHPIHGAAAQDKDTCDGGESQSWGPPCAPVHWHKQGPRSAQTLQLHTKAFTVGVVFSFVFC